MANKIYEENYIKNIANAIRQKTGKTDSLLVRDMAAQIEGISLPNDIVLQDKIVTENGEVTADEGYDGLGKVTVNVASTGSGNNGNFFIAWNPQKVPFVGYDGTVLKTQKVDDGNNATAPSNPTREGYEFAGWGKTFNNITSDLIITALYKESGTSSSSICLGDLSIDNLYIGDTTIEGIYLGEYCIYST